MPKSNETDPSVNGDARRSRAMLKDIGCVRYNEYERTPVSYRVRSSADQPVVLLSDQSQATSAKSGGQMKPSTIFGAGVK